MKRLPPIKKAMRGHEHKEANKNGQNTRTRRHRKERSRLFAELKDHQVTPEWNMPIKELRLLHKKPVTHL